MDEYNCVTLALLFIKLGISQNIHTSQMIRKKKEKKF